jgi:hypothetical protein
MPKDAEKNDSSPWYTRFFTERADDGGEVEPDNAEPDPDFNFNWFTLITIPDPQAATLKSFNEQVASYVNSKLRAKTSLSFVELYLSMEAMQRLYNEMAFDQNREALLRAINSQLPAPNIEVRQDDLRVSLFPTGLLITPALRRVFVSAFIARHLIRPQVHIPGDDSKIPESVKQYLIGELEVENQYGTTLGTTTIRALVQGENAYENVFRVSVHTDFDLLLKAFPSKEFCAYPLGVNIACTIREDANSRPIQMVSFDLHDTRLLEQWSRDNANTKLAYGVITGNNVVTDINQLGDSDIVPVEDFTDGESLGGAPEFSTAVAKNFPVPVNRRIGMKVTLRRSVQDLGGVRDDIVSYKFLFRFFTSALTYSPGFNKLQGTGQFVRAHGETVVMLPPLARDGKTEKQTPALVITPQTSGEKRVLRISKHRDSDLSLQIDNTPLAAEGVEVPLDEVTRIGFTLPGQEGRKQPSNNTFIVQPLSRVSQERRAVAERRGADSYVAFVEVNSDRLISLMLNEIILGRGQFLDRTALPTGTALTLQRPLVQWEMKASGEDVLYYSSHGGSIVTELGRVKDLIRLDLVGTYYIYLGDFEFMIYLESTPRTGLVLGGRV